MKRIGWTFLAGVVGLFLLAGADAPQTLHFPNHGYSIAPLEGPAGGGNAVYLIMFLPATDGFAPNVNVGAQVSTQTIDQYMTLTAQGLDKAGLKSIKAVKVDDNTATFEYSGTMNGNQLHWYAKAVRNGTDVILVTATATETQWPQSAAALQSCVDSFQRDAAQ